jgi:hypothetical protein
VNRLMSCYGAGSVALVQVRQLILRPRENRKDLYERLLLQAYDRSLVVPDAALIEQPGGIEIACEPEFISA